MGEYWVSHKKYFCKYCEIFIADDAPSRSQHENGLRHQGNKERYIKNLYKTGEKKKRDEEEEKREMARIEQAAEAAFANDVQTGHAKASTSSSVAISKPAAPKALARSGGSMANYTTARDLGIAQEEEMIAAEALRVQQSQGVVGQWQIVEASNTTTEAASTSSALPQKRLHPDDEDTEGAGYRVQRRKLAEGLGAVYDPGKITIVPKNKTTADETTAGATTESNGTTQTPAPTITWSKRRWRMAGAEDVVESDGEKVEAPAPLEEAAKPRDDENFDEPAPPSTSATEPSKDPAPLTEPVEPVAEAAPAKSMFKKRKAPTQPVRAKTGIRKQL